MERNSSRSLSRKDSDEPTWQAALLLGSFFLVAGTAAGKTAVGLCLPQ
jgi:hypothetical protein